MLYSLKVCKTGYRLRAYLEPEHHFNITILLNYVIYESMKISRHWAVSLPRDNTKIPGNGKILAHFKFAFSDRFSTSIKINLNLKDLKKSISISGLRFFCYLNSIIITSVLLSRDGRERVIIFYWRLILKRHVFCVLNLFDHFY